MRPQPQAPYNRPPGEQSMSALSILELVRVTEDTDARGALDNARDLAVHAENWNYRRIWVAEHHNMPGIASAATSVVLGHIAAGTKNIRVGAGGIMLPNHAPYVIAEQFGTLARLFPGRIDLGLGRAPEHRPAHAARLAPHARSGREFPAGRSRAAGIPGSSRSEPTYRRRCRLRERKCRCGYSDRAISERCSRPSSACPYAFASHFAPEGEDDEYLPQRRGRVVGSGAGQRPRPRCDRRRVETGSNIQAFLRYMGALPFGGAGFSRSATCHKAPSTGGAS